MATSASNVRNQIAKANLVAMVEKIWDNGFRQTTSSTPSRSRGRKT